MRNCLFEDNGISFTAKLEELTHRTSSGYVIKIQVPRSYAYQLSRYYDISTYRKDASTYILTVRLTNRTKILLNGKRIQWYDISSFKNIKKENIAINELVLKKYSPRLQETYQCPCYAIRLALKEKLY